jgi:hypothetical protein
VTVLERPRLRGRLGHYPWSSKIVKEEKPATLSPSEGLPAFSKMGLLNQIGSGSPR